VETQDRSTHKERINRISLGPFERRVLPWMATRLPEWIVPDHLTILGLFAALLIGMSYWLTNYSLNWIWLANFGFIVHWWADSLDGTLARVRHIERERYGFFIDHYSDTIAIFLICFGMGLSSILDMKVSLLLISAYYSITILVYLVTITRDVFKISFAGMGPTEVRLIVIIANIIVWYLDNPLIRFHHAEFTLYSLFGLVVSIILFSFFLIFGVIERRKLAQLDPPRSRDLSRSKSNENVKH